MRDAFSEVIQLQAMWSSANTEPMKQRGLIIRDRIPKLLRAHQERLQRATGISPEDFAVTGRDGTGRKTLIPWVRFYSRELSPKPTQGWYCVYLFAPHGDKAYLALAHGSTRFINGSFQPRNPDEVNALVSWAKGMLSDELADKDITVRMQLGNSELGVAYTASTIAAVEYSLDSLPSNDLLLADAERFGRMLRKLYAATKGGVTPDSESPELIEAAEAITSIARPLQAQGQGYGLSAEERKAVEAQAMLLASQYWEKQGYTVRDVSATQSYDLDAIKGNDGPLYIEVKGTTSGPDQILLTANEVTLHRQKYPNNALVIVYGISLDRSATPPRATGGTVRVMSPWEIDEAGLTPLSYRYVVPPA